MVIAGVLLVLVGTFEVFGARRLRDWSLRVIQQPSYLTLARVTGAIIVLAGLGFIAIGLGLLDALALRGVSR